MKLIINNFTSKSNIYISRLNNVEELDLYYEDLKIKNNSLTINSYNFKNGIYRIDLPDIDNVKFEFYNGSKLIYKEITNDCCIKIENSKITKYNHDEFNDQFEINLKNFDLFLVKHWNYYWYYLHWLTYNYPNNPKHEDKNEILKLINVMKKNGIKCDKCSKHFNLWIKKNDINKSLDSKKSLFTYFVNLHNDVNKRNKKKLIKIKEAEKIYQSKNWVKEFKNYKVDILNLFKERKLDTFPDLFYSVIEIEIMKDFDLYN